MPNISPPPITFASGGTVSSSQVGTTNGYSPDATPSNMGIMHGLMDGSNIPATYILRQAIQRHQVAGGVMSARNVNLDFFDKTFGSGVPIATARDEESVVVPGLATKWYQRWTPRAVYLSWHTSYIVDNKQPAAGSWNSAYAARMYLRINGTYGMKEYATPMKTSDHLMTWAITGGSRDAFLNDAGYLSGSMMFDATVATRYGFGTSDTLLRQGWQTAELVLTSVAHHVRIRSSRIIAIPLH